jgi:hypothetical protein
MTIFASSSVPRTSNAKSQGHLTRDVGHLVFQVIQIHIDLVCSRGFDVDMGSPRKRRE